MSTQRKILLALVAVAVLQAILYYPQLPDRVASHFDGSGRPNGWSSKAGFFILDLVMIALMTAIFFFLPRLLDRFPDGTVSLPNRDYWLAPERREKTFEFVQNQMLWMGIATLAFLICTFQLVIEANLDSPPALTSSFILLFVAYMGVVAVWTVRFIVRFTRVPRA